MQGVSYTSIALDLFKSVLELSITRLKGPLLLSNCYIVFTLFYFPQFSIDKKVSPIELETLFCQLGIVKKQNKRRSKTIPTCYVFFL